MEEDKGGLRSRLRKSAQPLLRRTFEMILDEGFRIHVIHKEVREQPSTHVADSKKVE